MSADLGIGILIGMGIVETIRILYVWTRDRSRERKGTLYRARAPDGRFIQLNSHDPKTIKKVKDVFEKEAKIHLDYSYF